jgi:Spy/CpxP family protein refolding chaperone
MSRLQRVVAAAFPLVVVCALLTLAVAQESPERGQGRRGPGGFGGFGGGGGEIALLQLEQVQKELGLDDDQKQVIVKVGRELRQKMQETFGGLRDLSQEERQAKFAELRGKMEESQKELRKKVDEVLNPQQKERLKEISLQARGVAALVDKELAAQLKLSDEQKQNLKQLSEESQKDLRDVFSAVRDGSLDREAAGDKMKKLQSEANEKALSVLLPQQREQFTQMQGKKIDIDRSQFGRGGGR